MTAEAAAARTAAPTVRNDGDIVRKAVPLRVLKIVGYYERSDLTCDTSEDEQQDVL